MVKVKNRFLLGVKDCGSNQRTIREVHFGVFG